MGVSIHYHGRLDDVGQLNALREEWADIAAAMGWPSVELDDDWDEPASARLRVTAEGAEIVGNLGLKGIQITPEGGTESLCFFFDREGNIRSTIDMISILDGTLDPADAWVSVKTQFGSPEVHVWIVGLLKYLKKRYMSDLQVSDEGQYWETGDICILQEKMEFIARKTDQLSDDLASGHLGDLSGDDIAARIEQWYLRNRNEDT